MFFSKRKEFKFFVSVGIFLLILNFIYFVPNILRNNGMMLEEIGEFAGVEYAYGNGNTYGLFRKSDEEYVKISKYAPLGNKYVFFVDDKIYYTARTLKIVEINLITFEETVLDDGNENLLLGVNDHYLVIADANDKSITKIVKAEGFEIIREINVKASDVQMFDDVIEFVDDNSSRIYRYHTITDQLEEF